EDHVQIAPLPLALKLVPEPTDAATVFDDDNRHILIIGVNQFFGHLAPPFHCSYMGTSSEIFHVSKRFLLYLFSWGPYLKRRPAQPSANDRARRGIRRDACFAPFTNKHCRRCRDR